MAAKPSKSDRNKFRQLPVTVPPVSAGTRFSIGDRALSPRDIQDLTPVFCFRHASLETSALCFDQPGLQTEDFVRLIKRLKALAQVTYGQMLHDRSRQFRFHTVDFAAENVSVAENDFRKAIQAGAHVEQLPSCYQLDAFAEKRIMGYLGYHGVFHVVWFDYSHSIYPGQDH